jgi:type 1 glutamine amidotransferase
LPGCAAGLIIAAAAVDAFGRAGLTAGHRERGMWNRRRWLAAVGATLVFGMAATGQAAEGKSHILFVTQSEGFRHGAVTRKEGKPAAAEIALTQLGETTGLFDVHCTQEVQVDFTQETLKNYDIVAFYTTGKLPIADADLDYFFNDWLKQPGHGVLGFHSAADTFHAYEPYYLMIGGTFVGHPWNAGNKVTLTNHDPQHPCVASFGSEFPIQDEIYMYRNWHPENVRVLLSLDYSKSPTNSDVNVTYGYHVPVCWVREWGGGKVYFNNLGHNETSWANEAYLQSITNAVKWIRGDIQADATPNPDVSAAQEQKAQRDADEHGFKIKKP